MVGNPNYVVVGLLLLGPIIIGDLKNLTKLAIRFKLFFLKFYL